MFADVSGFTRLTERLARRGKAGAEQLVDTISAVFTALLSATSDGGDVLKFGGDALLVFFGGEDHASRACHAAQGMQRALLDAGRLTTDSGRVRLRMSVGMHSGAFPFMLIGSDHLELVVTGPHATTTVAMESAADAGEILVSPDTAAAADGCTFAGEKSGGHLLRRVRRLPPVALVHDDPLPDDVLQHYIPRLLRGRLGPESAEHEHRQAIPAFLHFAGVDALIEQRGAAEVFSRLQALAGAVEEATTDLDICIITTDIGPDGGKYYLAAGTPDTGHDDEGRMLRACRRILDTDVGLPIRIGVNRGHVFGGDVGTPVRRTYSVMGDPVNLAARLMGRAPFGQLLAHRQVVERSRVGFACEAVPPFLVKGKSYPVDAVLVADAEAEIPASVADELPLIGREAELAVLRRALAEALDGTGRTVEIVGDAGMGKSRLVAALLVESQADTVSVLCDPYDQRTPYFAARLLLRKLLGIPLKAAPDDAGRRLREWCVQHAGELVAWLPLLAIVVDAEAPMTSEVEELAPRFRTARTHQAVHQLLSRALGPGVLVLEDATWMDDASAALVSYLLRHVAQQPWLVLITRDDAATGLHRGLGHDAEELVLAPLDRASIDAILTAFNRRRPLPPARLDALADRAAGNPLFLLELADAATTGDEPLPDSIEAMLASRIDQLDPADRMVLRCMAAIGVRFDRRTVDLALGDLGIRSDDEDLWGRLDHLLVREGDDVWFRHNLYRDVAYEGLTFARRRQLHGRIAEAYQRAVAGDGQDRAELLSFHMHHAHRYPEAWRFSVRAGDRARDAYANVEAAEYYRRALDAARHLPELPPDEVRRVAMTLGDVNEVAGLYAEADAAYRLARQHIAGDAQAEIGICLKRGVISERSGRYTQALRWYGKGLRLTETIDDPPARRRLRGQLQAGCAAARYRQGRWRDAARLARRSVADAARVRDLETLAHAYFLLDLSLSMAGEPSSGDARERALPIYEELGDLIGQANVLNNLGIAAYYAGDWVDALDLYRRSQSARLRAGDVVGAATAANNIGEILSDQGHLAEAERLFTEALTTWRGVDYPVGVALATSNLGRVAIRRGDTTRGRALLAQALRTFVELHADQFVLECRLRKVEADLVDGRWTAALMELQTLEAASAAATTMHRSWAERLRGSLLVSSGESAAGEVALRRAVELARDADAIYELAMALTELGATGDHAAVDEAQAWLAQLGVVRAPVEASPA